MSASLWDASAAELVQRTASSAPTPGGGSIAAVSGALGVALLQMAVAVTDDPALAPQAERLAALQAAIEPAADGDVEDFTVLMAAYRLPRADDAEKTARNAAIEQAAIAASERPLLLVASLVDALALSRELESLVKRGIVSDVLAGRDLVLGAARAGIRTADINIDQLDRLASAAAPALQARREELAAHLKETL